jgi:hypothetical protein
MPDTLSLRLLSILRRILDELLRRRARRASSGSCGCRPLARAKRLSTSVSEMTPLNRPERLAPGMADAEMAGAGAAPPRSILPGATLGGCIIAGSGAIGLGGTCTAAVIAGVGGPDDPGEGVSTTHMRWERVATSFATVWASVLKGVM